MSCLTFHDGDSPVHRLDPRVRLAGALGLAMVLALSDRPITLAWALAAAVALAVAARLPAGPAIRRLAHLNAMLLTFWLVLPWAVPGATAWTIGDLALTREGLRAALAITLKSNAIVLLFTALVTTMTHASLGCALGRLGLPDRLVLLFVLTVRYADVMHEESARLRQAMKARGFRPRFSMRTLRTFGYLVGLLLIRGMARAERVLVAMKCRGFDGQFRTLTVLTPRWTDAAFAVLVLAHAAAWMWMESA